MALYFSGRRFSFFPSLLPHCVDVGSHKREGGSSLVPSTFSEFLVPVVFTSFKPFFLREKRVPPTLVIIWRLCFQSPFFTQIKTSSFHRFFFVSIPFFRRQNIKNFQKLRRSLEELSLNPHILLKKAVLFFFIKSFPLIS